MKKRIQLCCFIVLILATLPAFSQLTNLNNVDTINIYKHKTGIRYRVYKKVLLYRRNHGYSYFTHKMNKQDSIVLKSDSTYYFKIYGRKNRLLYEGLRFYEVLTGDIKFYYRSGQIKRIEHVNNADHDVPCNNFTVMINDGPEPEGTWHYFRKNGTIKRKIEYLIKVTNCEQFDYHIVRKTSWYKRNGNLILSRNNIL